MRWKKWAAMHAPFSGQWLGADMGTFAQAATPTCRHHVEQSLAILRQGQKRSAPAENAGARKSFAPWWRATPELYRRIIVRCAGLPADVVGKIDRDLTESEKALLRAAIRDLQVSLPGAL